MVRTVESEETMKRQPHICQTCAHAAPIKRWRWLVWCDWLLYARGKSWTCPKWKARKR